MYDVMEGVRIIEVAEHTFAPAAAAMLADWGADVIKVERPTGGGDPARSLRILQRPGQKHNAYFEVANRGKRSVALDLTRPQGREQLYRLIETADVFITNLRRDALRKLQIEPEELTGRNPRLIYARATGYGTRGAMAGHGAFDLPSSWCRSGSAYVQTPATGEPPPIQPGSVGDLTGGATLAGAISAALFRRERTGKGAVVDHSLYAMGAFIMTQSITGASLAASDSPQRAAKPAPINALNRLYQTSDGRWLIICYLQDRWFPDLARRMDRADLLADARFGDEESRIQNGAALAEAMQETFAQKPLVDWCEILFDAEGVWAPLQSPAEVLQDVQALENGFVTPVTDYDGETYLSVATPCQFDERPVGELRSSPAFGQHTQEIMGELGLGPDQIEALREAKVIG